MPNIGTTATRVYDRAQNRPNVSKLGAFKCHGPSPYAAFRNMRTHGRRGAPRALMPEYFANTYIHAACKDRE